MAKILIFGDSITEAALEKKGGWVGRIRDFLIGKSLADPENKYTVYNLGISGNATTDLVERFKIETKSRMKEEGEVIIIFAIGVNDSQFIHSENRLRFSSEQIQDNLKKLLDLAQRFSSKIIFIGPTPVDEDRTTPIPWNPDKSYKNENISRNNEIVRSFCEKNKLYFVEVFEKLIKMNYQELLDDGLHPNSEGHQKIFEIVKEFLIKNRII